VCLWAGRRAIRKPSQSAQRSFRNYRNWAGRTAAICGLTLAGQHLQIQSRCTDWRRSLSLCSPISFFRKVLQPPRRCCKKRAPSPSFSGLLPIRSAVASSRASTDQPATLPVSPLRNRHRPDLCQSGHHYRADPRPLSGVKQILYGDGPMSAFDPKRTFGPEDCCDAKDDWNPFHRS